MDRSCASKTETPLPATDSVGRRVIAALICHRPKRLPTSPADRLPKLRNALRQPVWMALFTLSLLAAGASAQTNQQGSQPEGNPDAERSVPVLSQSLPLQLQSPERRSQSSERSVDEGAELPVKTILAAPNAKARLADRVAVDLQSSRISIDIANEPLGDVLNALAQEMHKNVVAVGQLQEPVSVTLRDVPLHDALNAILHPSGYQWTLAGTIYYVSPLNSKSRLPFHMQGRKYRVFHLNYVSASDIDTTVKGLLSPVGQSFVRQLDSEDKLKTQEALFVEDLPEYIERVERYIAEVDVPPRQVLIEAHILQVNLRDDSRHGVELENLTNLSGGQLTIQANGIANASASPAFVVDLNGKHLDTLVELIKETTDAKTLASPKVLAVNGQQARIQIGERLGYLTTTTTQTSTLQQVNFLDLGVVLTATPVIARDGKILFTVRPEVSSGRINMTTGLPDSDTTEVESTVLMPSGHAMVIGGLITEEDTDQQAKVPVLGDIPGVGKLFQRRRRVKDRKEIIIALMPRIVPYDEHDQHRHAQEVQRATTPLVYGPLHRTDRRRLEATIPSATCYYDEYGKPMECFPTPPVAYSPYFQHGEPVMVAPLQGLPVELEPPRRLTPAPEEQHSTQTFSPPVTAPQNSANRSPDSNVPPQPAPVQPAPTQPAAVKQMSGRLILPPVDAVTQPPRSSQNPPRRSARATSAGWRTRRSSESR